MSMRHCFWILITIVATACLSPAEARADEINCDWDSGAEKSVPLSLTPEEVSSDVGCMVDLLETVHPNVHLYAAPGSHQDIARQIDEEVTGPISSETAHSLLLRLVSAVCDEHTQLLQPVEIAQRWPHPDQVFSAPIYVAGGRVYVEVEGASRPDGTGREDVPSRTLELVSLNGVPADDIRDYWQTHIPVDGCGDTREILLPNIDSTRYLTRILGSHSIFDVEARDVDGSIVKRKVPATSVNGLVGYYRGLGVRSSVLYRATDYNERMSMSGWRYKLHENGEVGYLFISDFQVISEGDIRKIMRLVLADNPAKLVVDLTTNPGGFDNKSMLTNSFLIPRAHRMGDFIHVRRSRIYAEDHFIFLEGREDYPKMLPQFRKGRREDGNRVLRVSRRNFGNPSYRGKLHVLISHETGSAAVASAFTLKEFAGATLIGSTTHGAGQSTCGAPPGYYELPHSKMQLYVPYHCFRRTGKLAKKYRRGITPDIAYTPSPDSLSSYNLNLVDFALGYVEDSGLGEPAGD